MMIRTPTGNKLVKLLQKLSGVRKSKTIMADTPAFDGSKSSDEPNDATEMSAGDTDDTQITFTQQQLEDAGLQDLAPGDSFIVTLRGTVTDKGDTVTADIDELSDGSIDGMVQEPKAPPPAPPKGPMIKGPKDAGIMSAGPALPEE